MLLALARVVSTKVVLRLGANLTGGNDNPWDFMFNQSGMIGSAILFANARCGSALQSFPPQSIRDTFAVCFVGDVPTPPEETSTSSGSIVADGLGNNELEENDEKATLRARALVGKIAKLKVNVAEFTRQAEALTSTNVAFHGGVHQGETLPGAYFERDVIARWAQKGEIAVPQIITETVIAVPDSEDPGKVLASGAADATIAGAADQADVDVEAAKQAQCERCPQGKNVRWGMTVSFGCRRCASYHLPLCLPTRNNVAGCVDPI